MQNTIQSTRKNRKPQRLPGYDYSRAGYYFLTMCVKDRQNWFGEIRDREMKLNACGKIVKQQWQWLADQYEYVRLDEWVIMPNHIHGIIHIDAAFTNSPPPVRNGRDRSVPEPGTLRNAICNTLAENTNPQNPVRNGRDRSLRKIKSISELLGAFKTTSSKQIHRIGLTKFRWQKSFHDCIVRSESSLIRIQEYIRNNPRRWNMDNENPEKSSSKQD